MYFWNTKTDTVAWERPVRKAKPKKAPPLRRPVAAAPPPADVDVGADRSWQQSRKWADRKVPPRERPVVPEGSYTISYGVL